MLINYTEKRITQTLASALLVATCAFVTVRSQLEHRYREAAIETCRLVEQNFHLRAEPSVAQRIDECFAASQRQTMLWSREKNIDRINRRLALMPATHFFLFGPQEDAAVWEGERLETGLRSRMVDGHLIVSDIIDASLAARAGIRKGDELLSLNGEALNASGDAQTGAGSFAILRDGSQFLSFDLVPATVTEDRSVHQENRPHSVYLKISSFLAPYFPETEWRATVASIARENKPVVIDLRGNSGGDFVSMLRAASPFFCTETELGEVTRPVKNSNQKDEVDLSDDLDPDRQTNQIYGHTTIHLKTYENYGCIRQPVTVLIDSETASVAEIFALAFTQRPHARVWGQPSAGAVVMAKWFPVTNFGTPNYLVSIPVAGFRAPNQRVLENQGLVPPEDIQRVLQYNLEAAKRGVDNWRVESETPF